MSVQESYDAIIVGGSFAGLSAAMALGRARKRVLIIDSNQPCNKQTPHSHNFITQDGEKPAVIKEKALQQVLQYETVKLLEDLAIDVIPSDKRFDVQTQNNGTITTRKVLFTTGIKDTLPDLPGFKECWGISLIHCPYCHGYEVRDIPLGIIANGDMAMHFVELLLGWSKDLILLTNGPSMLTEEQLKAIARHQVKVLETPVKEILHKDGYMNAVTLADGDTIPLNAVFIRAEPSQHSSIPEALGCEIGKNGLIVVDELNHTSVPGIYAAGDNSNMFRAVSIAVGAGTKAGASINRDLLLEDF
ncbi:NAD(P)/FAD-dependent oxidoreductase [Chitinophaga silvatica]|uniref:NAD(P)/FAD-dependent oxidoreductase n=1 Tax=Chitinophaga silvatica TaxID=2282649 RepID=A0A3E1Y8Z0_9BACT|nr:NAD(P)/FAD-dependent oxidoreductase [Chitinophaga silvatica]RFS21919.1 NAD(P)/FAD-dependent oxidoreductase [Chitinophaga silvatica]